ncbi:hypothetical protein PG997_000487 [Apiospora hydei]|uniref:Uncharacterized protein n=1 Tax=Apiospora hydei TaxID=1337664 RepID=A0ABR1XB15_9PEZI
MASNQVAGSALTAVIRRRRRGQGKRLVTIAVIPTALLHRRSRLLLSLSRPALPERPGELCADGIDDESQPVELPEQIGAPMNEELAQAAVVELAVQPRPEVPVGLDARRDRKDPGQP